MGEASLPELSTDQNARVPERQHPLHVKKQHLKYVSMYKGM